MGKTPLILQARVGSNPAVPTSKFSCCSYGRIPVPHRTVYVIQSSKLYALLEPEKFGFRPVVMRKNQPKVLTHPLRKLLVMKDQILQDVRTGELYVFLYTENGQVFTRPYEHKML